jgi:hypothetical protein
MAIDIEAIRRRVQELSGQRNSSSIQLWKPEAGEFRIRGLPWKNTTDGMPFIERWFYYIGNNSGILAPSQFGKPDPINDLMRKLYSTGKVEDRLLAKKLQPKMRAYMAIIVRGQEDKGVQVWSFGKVVYQRLLSFFTDEEVGDILDPMTGFDLKVVLAPSAKKVDGRSFLDTTIDAARRPSKLSEDAEQAKKWLDSVPNIDDLYRQKTAKEIEQILNAWLAGDAGDAISENLGPDEGLGRDRNSKQVDDALDQLVNEVKAEVKVPAAEAKVDKQASKRGKKHADVDLDDAAPAVKQNLDDAFAELMNDMDDK